MTGLDRLIQLQRDEFVAGLRGVSPDLAAWAKKRLDEGFTVAAVQVALEHSMKAVRATKATA